MPVADSQNKGPHSVSMQSSVSGSGMDRVIAKKRIFNKPLILGLIVLLSVAGLSWLLYTQNSGRSLSLNNNRVVISTVKKGVYEDFIPIRGQVTPRKTVYLDLIEGGQVDTKLVEDGVLVKAGDLLVVMNNTTLQLDVTRNEAMVAEQLNNMRSIELQLEQNRLQHKRSLIDMDYQIKRLGRKVDRLSNLDSAGVASKSQLEDAADELEYFKRQRSVTLESQETDARLQETQLKFIRESAGRLEDNLGLSRKNLDALNVRAPVDGKLSGFDLEVGQSVQRGGRLGQIDDPDNFKLKAYIDEYYLSRVIIGQSANFELDRQTYSLYIAKIYPQVNNGQFQIDLIFGEQEPKGIRYGQTLQAKLTLGDPSPALLIPNGAFYQDTGGNWMFVLSEDGSVASKRSVKLGRRNAKTIEILEGLEEGEQVITSPYSSFKEMDRLNLTSD